MNVLEFIFSKYCIYFHFLFCCNTFAFLCLLVDVFSIVQLIGQTFPGSWNTLDGFSKSNCVTLYSYSHHLSPPPPAPILLPLMVIWWQYCRVAGCIIFNNVICEWCRLSQLFVWEKFKECLCRMFQIWWVFNELEFPSAAIYTCSFHRGHDWLAWRRSNLPSIPGELEAGTGAYLL